MSTDNSQKIIGSEKIVMEMQQLMDAANIYRIAEWLIRGIGMAGEIGESYTAVTLPGDMLLPQGSIVISSSDVAVAALGVVALIVIVAIIWRARHNHRERRALREGITAMRADVEKAAYQYAKIEKDYNRLKRDEMRQRGGAEIDKVLRTLGYDRGEVLEMLATPIDTQGGDTATHQNAVVLDTKETVAQQQTTGVAATPTPLRATPVATPRRKPATPTMSGVSRSVARSSDTRREATPADVSKWASDRLQDRDGYETAGGTLLQDFNVWCEEHGLVALGKDKFGPCLETLGYVKIRKRLVMYQNVALRPAGANLKVVK